MIERNGMHEQQVWHRGTAGKYRGAAGRAEGMPVMASALNEAAEVLLPAAAADPVRRQHKQ